MFLRLDNGAEIVVRPIRPDDGRLLAEGIRHLSEESSYQRFLGLRRELNPEELRYLTEIDFVDHVAYVAFRREAPDVLVAVGRWVRLRSDPEVAEIAFVVADELQHHGLGTALGELLAEAARERGVKRFVATMLPENVAAHRLFAHLAQFRRVHAEGGLHELQGELTPAA